MVGLVVGSASVQESKAELKSAHFSLSAASGKVVGKLSPALLLAAKETAEQHATSLGAVLSSLVLPVLPEDADVGELLQNVTVRRASEKKSRDSRLQNLTLQPLEIPFLERANAYREIIEKENGTVLLVVPTQAEIDEWSSLLSAYKPLVLSGKVTGKRREQALTKAVTTSPRLVLCTPTFAWLPLPHLSHILVERVSSGTYSLPKRPYLDIRFALHALASARKIPLMFGDYPLPLEYRAKPDAALNFPNETMHVLDTRRKKEAAAQAPWQAVPEPVRKQIAKALECTSPASSLADNGLADKGMAPNKVAVLAVRRGYAPTVVCGDCGTTLKDELGRTLSLATLDGKRVFRTSDGALTPADQAFCKNCGSWNLMPLGIGIERVEEELRQTFPEARLLRIDQDSQKNPSLKKIRAAIAEADLILGTEFMLPYLSPSDKVSLGVIASADSLLALPFWRARERFVRVCLMLSERAEKTIIATRQPEDSALQRGFWKEETGLRAMLKYPPFGTLLVFHMEGTQERIAEYRAAIREACVPFVPFEIPEKMISSTKFHASSVLQLPKEEWPNEKLIRNIARLSPAIRHTIDSENLW